MAHGDARAGKWKGNWRVEWVASALHTSSEHGVSSITTADAHTSAASSRLNWLPLQFKWTLRFAERRNLVSAHVPSYFKRRLPEGSLLHPLYFYQTKSNSVRSPVLQLVNISFNIILSDCRFLSGFPTNILYAVPLKLTLRYFPRYSQCSLAVPHQVSVALPADVTKPDPQPHAKRIQAWGLVAWEPIQPPG
jgi:hypothetical protein